MAITLDSMVRNVTASQKAGVSISTKADLATGAFELASQRIGQQANAANVQLSAFGLVKSSFVEVQSAGKNLTTPAKTSTIEDLTKSLQSFADAYNKATITVGLSRNGTANSAGVLADNGLANLAGFDLKRIVNSGNTIASLNKIGVTQNKDGTLDINTNALKNSFLTNPAQVQNTLAKVGAQAIIVSQRELASTGNIGSSMNTLSIRSKNLASQASSQQILSTNSNTLVQQQTANYGNAANGIAEYLKMFSL
jgi:hypothetical protein